MEADNKASYGIGPEPQPARTWRVGLSGKLLLLTILFVMVAEILIYVPSVANFRLNWLNDRLAAAHTAAEHKVVAGRAEEDKFGKQQASGQNTCKLLSGTGAVLLLCVGNIS